MRAITKCETKVVGNKITITGELVDITMPMFIGQRNTIMNPVNGDMNHPRHLQITTHGAMVLRNGSDCGVLFPKDEFMSVMVEIDYRLTNPPVFSKHPCSANPVGMAKSETALTAKVEHSDDGKTWSEVKVGKGFKPAKGKHYRCVASNKSGTTVSQSFKHK